MPSTMRMVMLPPLQLPPPPPPPPLLVVVMIRTTMTPAFAMRAVQTPARTRAAERWTHGAQQCAADGAGAIGDRAA